MILTQDIFETMRQSRWMIFCVQGFEPWLFSLGNFEKYKYYKPSRMVITKSHSFISYWSNFFVLSDFSIRQLHPKLIRYSSIIILKRCEISEAYNKVNLNPDFSSKYLEKFRFIIIYKYLRSVYSGFLASRNVKLLCIWLSGTLVYQIWIFILLTQIISHFFSLFNVSHQVWKYLQSKIWEWNL